jgi:hypothetical protein
MGFFDFLINQSGLTPARAIVKNWASQIEPPAFDDYSLEGRRPFENPHYYSDSDSDTESEDHQQSNDSFKVEQPADTKTSTGNLEEGAVARRLPLHEDNNVVIAQTTFETVAFRQVHVEVRSGMQTSFDYSGNVVYSSWADPWASTSQTSAPAQDAAYSPHRYVRYNIPGFEYQNSEEEEEEEEDDEGVFV